MAYDLSSLRTCYHIGSTWSVWSYSRPYSSLRISGLLHSSFVKLFEAYHIGNSCPSKFLHICITPQQLSDASMYRRNGFFKSGYCRISGFISDVFSFSKDCWHWFVIICNYTTYMRGTFPSRHAWLYYNIGYLRSSLTKSKGLYSISWHEIMLNTLYFIMPTNGIF